MAASDQVQREVNEAEDEWSRVVVAGDADGLGRLVADDAVICHGSGDVEGKAPFVGNVFGRLEFKAVERRNALIRAYGDVAISTCLQEQTARLRADPNAAFAETRSNVTKVWVHRDGRWHMASYHATRLAK